MNNGTVYKVSITIEIYNQGKFPTLPVRYEYNILADNPGDALSYAHEEVTWFLEQRKGLSSNAWSIINTVYKALDIIDIRSNKSE